MPFFDEDLKFQFRLSCLMSLMV